MASQIAFDWFYLNHTKLSHQYGPWPLWDVLTNYTNIPRHSHEITSHTQHESPATFGFATGALLILALTSKSQFNLEPFKIGLSLLSTKQFVYQILTATLLTAIVPIIATFFVALALYKRIAAIYLKRELLCGADAVWALDADDANSRAIVNVLMILNDKISLEELRNLVETKLLPASAKLNFYRKYSSFGYFYWDHDGQKRGCNAEPRVQMLEGCKEGEEMTEDELRSRISTICNAALPEGHSAGWQVLLGPQLCPESGRTTPRTAVLFRVHHSMGDGPALCRMFISAVADPQPLDPRMDELINKAIASKSRSHSRFLDQIVDGVSGMLSQLTMQPDRSLLHGPLLSGSKQVAWRTSEELMHATQRVRRATRVSFSAVLLSALTSSVAEYLTRRGTDVATTTFSVVVPVRLPRQFSRLDQMQELDNAFSMTLVRCLLSSASAPALVHLRAAESALKFASNPATLVANSCAVQLVGELLPRPLATLALQGGQCTSVLSNMPGPTHQISLAGRSVSQLTFWVPHRTNTGVGASVLSYAGHLTLGLIVDEALLQTRDDAQHLVCAWERHILQLEESICGGK